MTVEEAIEQVVRQLSDAGVAAPRDEAKRLLGLAMPRRYVDYGDVADGAMVARFLTYAERRARREPFSHIAGYRHFWKGRFTVTPDVLDPRPDTETLVEVALERPFSKVLDLGTGSGCILISLLMERPEARGVGTDVSEKAVLIAGENAVAHEVADRLILPLSDWFEDVGGRYDLIVSNPPYISADEMAGLAPEVREFEPHGALTDDGDGLAAYRVIAQRAPHHLTPNGRLIVEVGVTQSQAVMDIFKTAGLENTRSHNDLTERPRVVSATAPRREIGRFPHIPAN